MRQSGYDRRDYVERNWKTLGPQLVGKLHIAGGYGHPFPRPRRLPNGDIPGEYEGGGEGAGLCGDGRVWEAAQAAWVAALDESGVAQDHDRAGGELSK
jgi:hypothetical protein